MLVEEGRYVPPTLQESGSVGIAPLRDRHKGERAWIVGKGPSLARIRASDFGPGPVIVINEAIAQIQVLGLPNHIYAMQIDGCEVAADEARPCGSCAVRGWRRDPLIDPYPGIATVFSRGLSSWCLHGRPNRFVFEETELGDAEPHTMSVLRAIPFAQWLGATSVVMVAFDSLTTGDLGSIAELPDPEMEAIRKANLEFVAQQVIAMLRGVPHQFLTPGR